MDITIRCSVFHFIEFSALAAHFRHLLRTFWGLFTLRSTLGPFPLCKKNCFRDVWSENNILRSPHGYGVRIRSEWVEDSGGNKVLWLPPSWRYESEARWDGNFLALVNSKNPVPVIIEFQLRSLLSLTCSTDT